MTIIIFPPLLKCVGSNCYVFCCKQHTTFSFGQEEKSSPFFYEDVPECLSSSLTTFHFKGFNGLKINELELTFHFKGFDGLKNELELVRDILMRAKVLKAMSISSYPLKTRFVYSRNYWCSVIPRLSSTCQIAFDFL